jgi:hypothetical protein
MLADRSHWGKRDANHALNTALVGDENFEGPVTKRKCTDVFFLIIFIVLNFVFTVFAIYTILDGDVERVLHGADFRAELCGVDDLSDKEYLYWPKPNVDLDLKICMAGCPVTDAKDVICLYDNDHVTDTPICFNSY